MWIKKKNAISPINTEGIQSLYVEEAGTLYAVKAFCGYSTLGEVKIETLGEYATKARARNVVEEILWAMSHGRQVYWM